MGAAALPTALVLQTASGIGQAFSEKAASRAEAGYMDLLAQFAEGNARLVELAGERQASNVKDAAAFKFRSLLRDNARIRGTQRAAFAAKGTSGTVTAQDIARDTDARAQLDEDALRFNADSASEEILRTAGIEAFNLRTQAGGHRVAARNRRRAGDRAFFGTLLGTATSVASTVALSRFGSTRTTGSAPTPGVSRPAFSNAPRPSVNFRGSRLKLPAPGFSFGRTR